MSFLPQVSRHREGTVLDTYKWPATSHLVFPACLGGRTSLSPPMSQRGSATSPSNTVWCPGPASTSGESGPDLAGFFIPPWDPRLKFTPPPQGLELSSLQHLHPHKTTLTPQPQFPPHRCCSWRTMASAGETGKLRDTKSGCLGGTCAVPSVCCGWPR